MSGSQVDPSAATPEDYSAGVVAGYPATGAAPAPVSSPPAAPDQPALQTDPNTSQSSSALPSYSQDDINKALKNLADKQQKARTEHAQTWMDKLGAKDGVLDPSRIEASQIQTGLDPDNNHGFFRDFGDRLWGATLESGKDALGAVSALENYAGASPEELAAMENIKAGIQKHVEATYNDLSNAGKQALTASIWDGSAFQNPGRYLAGNLADVIPQGALAIGAGVGAAAAAPEEAMAATGALIAKYAPQVLGKVLPGLLGPKMAGTLATMATFGGLNAGQTFNALVDQVASATPKQLMDVPVYKEAIAQGKSDTEARQDVIHTTTAPFVALSGAVGAAAGAGFGAVATGSLLPAGASLLKRAMVSGGEAGVTMGLQNAGGDIAQQEGNIAVGTQEKFDPAQTAIAAASGVVGGFALGGPLGLFHGAHADGAPVKPPAAVPQPVETHIDPAQKAALDVTLTTPAPTPATTDQPDASQTPGGAPTPSPALTPGVEGAAPPPAPTQPPAPAPTPATSPGTTQPAAAEPSPQPPAPPTKGVPVRSIQEIVQDEKVPPQQAVQVQRQEIAQNAKVAEERANPPANPPSQTPEPAAQSPQEPPPLSAANAPPVPAEPVQGMAPEKVPPAGPQPSEVAPPAGGEPTNEVPPPAPAAPGASGPAAGPEATPAQAVSEPGVAAQPTPEPINYRQRIAEVQDREHPRDAVLVPVGARGVGVGFKGVFVATKKDVGRFYSTDPEKITAFKNLKPEEVTPEKINELEEPGKLKTTEPEEAPAPEAAPVAPTAQEETPAVPTSREEEPAAPVAPPAEAAAPPAEAKPETPQERLLRIREEQKAKRAAEKARIQKITQGEQFEKDKNVHVETPAEGEAEKEPEPVIQAKPEPIPAEDEEEPRDDISETYREDVGEAEPEIIPGEGEAEGPAIAQQDIDLGDKTRADTSTDRSRDAKDLIAKVDDGLMTIHEAANEFEWKPGKKGGRPAKPENRNLSAYIKKIIPLFNADEINKKIDDLVQLLSKPDEITKLAMDAKKKMDATGKKYNLATHRDLAIGKIVEQVKDLQEQIKAHERLKNYLEALEKGDQVGDAVRDEITPPAPKGPSVDKVLRDTEKKKRLKAAAEEAKARELNPVIEPYADRVNRHLADNTNFIDAIKDAQDHGQTYRLKDALTLAARNIAKGGPETNYIRNLLTRLSNMVPDLETMTSDHAYDLGKLDRRLKNQFDTGHISGLHKTSFNKDFSIGERIVIVPSRVPEGLEPRMQAMGGPVALAHEAIHAVTFRAISDIAKIPLHSSEDLPLIPMRDALKAINNEFVRAAKEANYAKVLDDIAGGQVEYTTGKFYHEVATQLLTNPEVHAFASTLKPSEAFLQEMRRLGFDKSPTTLWEYFKDWLRRALGLQKPGSAFEGSLLEAVMAPLQHVLERSAAYEKAASLLPGRETGGAPGELASMLRGALGPRVDGQVDRALRYIDLGGVTDRARSALLVATTWDGIVKKYRSMFQTEDHGDALHDLRAAKEKIDRVNAQYIKANGDVVEDLIKRLQGREELAELMNDATVAKARLGNSNPNANKNVKNIQELTDRYNNLSAADRQTYQDLRDHYAKMYEERATAERTALIDNFLPDATPAQKQAVDDLLKKRSPKEIQAFIDNADTSDIAKMFADKWDRSKNFVTGIADLVKGNKLAGDYFPLRRYGDYVLTYGDSANDATSDADPLTRYGVEMFEKKSDAIARKAELEQAGHANVSEVMTKQESMDKSLKGNIPFVKKMLSSLDDSSLTAAQIQEARDLLTSVVLEHGTTSDAARIARRKGIGGASKDAARTLASEHLNFAYRIGRMLHGGDLQDALTRMRNTVVDMGRRGAGPNTQIVANAVLHEMEQRVKASSLTTSFTSELARKATNFGFMQSVASPSIMLKHTLEAQMNATALLAPRHGAKATLALGNAMRDLGPRLVKEGAAAMFKAARKGLNANDWDMGRYGLEQLVKNGADRGQMERLFEKANAAGLIDHTMDKDIRDIAKGGSYEKGKLSTVWNRFRDFNTVGAHAADVMNRMVIAKAAFDLELEKTGSEGVAIERAIDTLRDAIPNYGGKARIATEKGPLGKIALPLVQFKNYGLHMYSVMLGLAHQSLRGADATERKEAALALAGILGTHALMAGSLTILGDPLTLAGVAYGAATGQTKPHDFEADLRSFFSDVMGPTMGEIFSRGLPHAIGIDLSHSIGLSNLLEMPELEGFDSKSFLKWLGAIATGAAGEDASNEVGGLLNIYHGNYQKGFEAMLPRPLRDPLKAIRYANEGIPGPGGRPGLPAESISPAGIVGQALGFQPADVSEYREGRAAVEQAKAEAQVEQQRLSQAWVTAADNDARTEAMQAIQQYNADHPGEEIQMPTLFAALRRARLNQTAQPNAQTFGLELSPRQAKAMAQAGRFANVN